MSNFRLPRELWWGLLAVNIGIIGFYWWAGSGSLFGQGLPGMAIALGRLSGLAAALTVLLQFLMMGRTPWLERSFGLDHLARLHRRNGQLSLLFLLAHPLLLTIGYSQLVDVGFWHQLWLFLTDYKHVVWAGVGLVLFAVVVISSLVIVRRRWRYETWYFVHLIVYLAVFASFWHQIAVGEDILRSRFFYGYWLGLYVVVLSLHVLFRLLRPLLLYERHRWRVARVVRETPSAVSLYITGRQVTSFTIYPGQFMILRFLTRQLWWQAHPFSLSMVPNGKELRITIKELGDFTKQVAAIPVGTPLIIDGPFGVFTEWVHVSPKILFIAGGIGITPIRSLMERLLQRRRDAVLLYANRTEKDIVFRQELSQLTEQHGGRVVDIISDDPNFAGERGRLTAERITQLVPDVATRDVYLCGPPPMMEALIRGLRHLGVPHARIHYEKFSL